MRLTTTTTKPSMKIIKYLLFLLLILAIGFAIYIAVQPNEFDVQRSRTIEAPTAVVFNNVNDYKNWKAWSSWIEKNPETKITYAPLLQIHIWSWY